MNENTIYGPSPRWTPESVGGVVFTWQQLYLLLGGPDYGRFAVPPSCLSMGCSVDERVLAGMRRDMVAALQPLGLVDADCVPCSALGYLLDPVRSSRFDLMDGVIPSDNDPDRRLKTNPRDAEDLRTFCAYFGTGSATLLCNAFAADGPGVVLLDLGGPGSWEESFMRLTRLGSVWQYSLEPMRIECDSQKDFDRCAGMMHGKSSDASALASGRANGDRLVQMAAGRGTLSKGHLRLGWMVSHDYRCTRLAETSQLRDMRVGPEPRTVTQIIPAMGAMFGRQTVPASDPGKSVWEPGDGGRTRGVFELVASGSVLERLLGVAGNY
ncbi:hypothetical protein OZX74_06735 [Bifidobacterium sp. ESL0798]|uniref:hypothetical protein n=1 Tax=Bifidobacterium sp. ESL0798 TaxID=2983235 RepID=UPI0023F8B5BB|nr:hypothetical protein [Bifidobacterium sp. ESL0798]WEV73607.1 hypothetical protein OZX74_06735 [Bifidobacterium sp. ESL0798]